MGGYYNNAVGTHLSYNAIYTALKNLWQSTSTNPGSFRADPAEIISSGIDIANLSQDVINQGAGTNYQLFIQQGNVGDVTVGAAVWQFQNPLTRSLLKLVVHPWYTQGNATLLSYQLPQTWTNVANAWEMSMVQDYVSIALLTRWRGRVTCRKTALFGEPHLTWGSRLSDAPVTRTQTRPHHHPSLAGYRRHVPLLIVRLRCAYQPRPVVLGAPVRAPEQRRHPVQLDTEHRQGKYQRHSPGRNPALLPGLWHTRKENGRGHFRCRFARLPDHHGRFG